MSGISSMSSSLYSLLSSYYTTGSSSDETSETTDDSTTDSTESSDTIDQEEATTLSLSLTQGLVDTLSSLAGISTDDDSDALSRLYDAIEMQQNSDTIADALAEYYTDASSESDTDTGSSIDTTA